MPIVNDSGYNVFSSFFYSILVIVFLFFVTKLNKSLSIKIDTNFLLSLTPFLFAGSIWRVIEDTGLFHNSAIHYIFISPFIYLLFTIIVFLGNYIGLASKKIYGMNKSTYNPTFTIPIIFFLLFLSSLEQYVNISVHIPIQHHIMLILALSALIYIFIINKISSHEHLLVLFTGIHLTAIGVLLIVELNNTLIIVQNSNISIIIYQTIGYSTLFLLVFVVLLWYFRRRIKRIYSIIFQPFILLIILGMLIDGFTSICANKLSYLPKHILTSYLLDSYGIEYILLLKIIMILFFIIFIERLDSIYNQENLKHNIFYILFLFTMMTINFSPAMRVIIRMCLNT